MSPSRQKTFAVVSSMLTLAGVLLDVPLVRGESFRVENKVFVGNREKPISQSTTIFHDGVVYDYLEDPAEVIVFEKDPGRFTLLDTIRRIRTELPTTTVATFTEQLQHAASVQEDPFLKFLAAPKFDEQFDENSNELTLSSPWLTYRIHLVDAGSRTISQQYREFSDGYAQVNAILSPGSKPPFARLLVNEALAKREAIAHEVHLTMTPKKRFPPKRVALRSQHQLVPRVVEGDLDRVAQTRQFMQIYKLVGFEHYRHSVER